MELEVIHASHKRDGYTILKGIELKLVSSKIYGFIGNNNSILMELISGNTQLNSGSIYLNKLLLDNSSISTINKNISLIKRNPKEDLNKNNFLANAKLITDKRSRIIDSLKIVGLDETYINKNISESSNSELKLMQIALCLINNPKVIIFDEPFTYLDDLNKKRIIKLIKALKYNYNRIVVISSNDSDLLYELTDELFILGGNTIVASGKTTDLFKSTSLLNNYNIDIPYLIDFIEKAKEKNIKLTYTKDIRDLIKDVYKHV